MHPHLMIFNETMDQQTSFSQLLMKTYPSYRVEVEAFIENAHISKSTNVSVDKIYEAIRDDPDVNENLKLLYREALYGSNKDVKSRIRNRVANFRRGTK